MKAAYFLEMKDLRNNTMELSKMHIWKDKQKKKFHTSKKDIF